MGNQSLWPRQKLGSQGQASPPIADWFGEGLRAPGYETVLENVVRSSESSSLGWLSEVGRNLGSWNVRGGLLSQPGKMEAVVNWAREHNVGILGLQEMMVPGIGQQWLADGWTLLRGGGGLGPSSGWHRLPDPQGPKGGGV
jgi:hypothetical protein